MGLAFSVPRGFRPLPPSLRNMFKEAAADLGWADRPADGDLSAWSVQGVLLLNTCLTVRKGEANSHSKRGWEALTDAAVRALSARRSGLVFLLWGKPAQEKAGLIDADKHHILMTAHPSPLSVRHGFDGCRHFSKANDLLTAQGLPPIDWRPT
ncbi:Uracil-DNA glycosylase [Tetrabaena socialis]|uniref:Uracil-DNA glycosylase n=1 Tax=Tetrabaena socialis TaxID=47790 RepID=A0A2J8A3F6_9CHLO|nr:Uracil-DNA glycosylase [Tetrabaena socialis]|eukprot:PNH07051.1 Uracil-DNA glycosylase [Tetrabaena socialis]